MRNKIVLLSALLLSVDCAMAVGRADHFAVVEVRADNEGIGYVKFASPLNDSPASCTTSSYTNMLAFDLKTPGGRATMALALAAQLSGKPVWARGTGACTLYPAAMEDWSYGKIEQ